MIRFAAKPDSVFIDLVNCAVTDIVENYLSMIDPREQEEWLCACLPRSARFFTAPDAKQQVLLIQHIHQEGRLYQMTKYHWLLLYECLQTFSQQFNEQPMGWFARKYGLQRIEFGELVQLFFWDTSFLSDHLTKMSLQDRRTMLIWPETVGLSAGFKTHPDELVFTLCDETLTKEFEERKEVAAWTINSNLYPSL